MDKLRRYQEKKALAEANYMTMLAEAKRMMGEAYPEYEKEKAKALTEYKSADE